MVLCVRVRKEEGERVRKYLLSKNMLDTNYLPTVEGNFLYLPIKAKIPDFEVVERDLKRRRKQPKDIADALKGILNEKELEILRKSFDIIGDIAILQIPDDLMSKKEIIARAIMKVHKNVKVVVRKRKPISGEYRVMDVEIIAGDKRTETVHREYRCLFKLDVSKVFYTPRLSTERIRIARLVKDNEAILDMFAGVGPFSIIIAKHSQVGKVYAIDKNPHAYYYLKENIKLNKVENIVIPILGDARDVVPLLNLKFDRIIMNLPKNAKDFLDVAISAIKDEGVIHYHAFSKGKDKKDAINLAISEVENIIKKMKIERFSIIYAKDIREVSPREYNIAIDIKIKKT